MKAKVDGSEVAAIVTLLDTAYSTLFRIVDGVAV